MDLVIFVISLAVFVVILDIVVLVSLAVYTMFGVRTLDFDTFAVVPAFTTVTAGNEYFDITFPLASFIITVSPVLFNSIELLYRSVELGLPEMECTLT